MINDLYLGWQDSQSRRWFVIGRLSRAHGAYQFGYLRGARDAQGCTAFQPLIAFPRLDSLYESSELFPFFATRMMPASRPDYASFLQWLGLGPDDADPFEVLARSEALQATDRFCVFAAPWANGEEDAAVVFRVHGLRHAAESSKGRVVELSRGERLLVLRDIQNPQDPNAIALRTAEAKPGDMYLMGYCPRYYACEFRLALEAGADVRISVERVNPEPAPWDLRLIVSAEISGYSGKWMSSPEYAPLAVPLAA